MRRFKLLCIALMSLFAVGVMTAAAASAESTPLPDIHVALPGESYPLNLGGHLAGVSKLENTGGGLLEGTEFSILLNVTELSALGGATIEFLGVKEVKESKKCHTTGASEANGEVIIPNAEFHLVYTALSPSENLEVGALVLFTKFVVSCNAGLFEITNTGPSMSRLNLTTGSGLTEGDANDLQTASNCPTNGVQELPYYYNDSLERVATTLLANVSGKGNVQACEEIEGTILLTPETGSAATMFSVLG
jgi:hypothetical protein